MTIKIGSQCVHVSRTTIMDKFALLALLRTSQTRIQPPLPNPAPPLPRPPPPAPYNVDNYCLQFLLIFNIVLGGRFFKTLVLKHR